MQAVMDILSNKNDILSNKNVCHGKHLTRIRLKAGLFSTIRVRWSSLTKHLRSTHTGGFPMGYRPILWGHYNGIFASLQTYDWPWFEYQSLELPLSLMSEHKSRFVWLRVHVKYLSEGDIDTGNSSENIKWTIQAYNVLWHSDSRGICCSPNWLVFFSILN